MSLLDRKQWSEAYFTSLSLAEQNRWIAWEYRYQAAVEQALADAHTPNTDGNLYAEIVTPKLLALLVTLGGIGGRYQNEDH